MLLVLFSGLAASPDVFGPQKFSFPQLVVPDWPIPMWSESMDSYCQRLADMLRTEFSTCDELLIIGGASFGGIIALHVAKYLKPQAVLLIGSIRSSDELPRYARMARPLKSLIRWIPVRAIQWILAPLATKAAHRFLPLVSALTRQFRWASPQVFRWSLRQVLDWRNTPKVNCPIYHIHGQRDWVLPLRYTTASRIVKGGGHLISLTHPREVNEFIRDAIADIATQQKTADY